MRLRGGAEDEEIYQQFEDPQTVKTIVEATVAENKALCMCDQCTNKHPDVLYRLDFRKRDTAAKCAHRHPQSTPGPAIISAYMWLLRWKERLDAAGVWICCIMF